MRKFIRVTNIWAFMLFTLIIAPIISFEISSLFSVFKYTLTFVKWGFSEWFWLWFNITLFSNMKGYKDFFKDNKYGNETYLSCLKPIYFIQIGVLSYSILSLLCDFLGLQTLPAIPNSWYINVITLASLLWVFIIVGRNERIAKKNKQIYCKDCKYYKNKPFEICEVKPSIVSTYFEPKTFYARPNERNGYNNCAYFSRRHNSDSLAKLKKVLEDRVNNKGWHWILYAGGVVILLLALVYIFRADDFKDLYKTYKDKFTKKKQISNEEVKTIFKNINDTFKS